VQSAVRRRPEAPIRSRVLLGRFNSSTRVRGSSSTRVRSNSNSSTRVKSSSSTRVRSISRQTTLLIISN
jgi:hypothetical protein